MLSNSYHRGSALGSLLAVLCVCGCTGVSEYFHNGCKVGPDYKPPCAPVANKWIDAGDKRLRTDCDDLAGWWTIFDDALLNDLIGRAYNQNLTLREAGYRILAARAQLGIVRGEFFPQSQDASGAYRRFGVGDNFFDQWNFGFNLSWELDFWGRFRRAILAAEDSARCLGLRLRRCDGNVALRHRIRLRADSHDSGTHPAAGCRYPSTRRRTALH